MLINLAVYFRIPIYWCMFLLFKSFSPCLNLVKDLKNRSNVEPYVPGDLTEPLKRDDSYDALVERIRGNKNDKIVAQGYPKYRDDFYRPPSEEKKDLKTEAQEFYNKHKEMLAAEYQIKHQCSQEKRGTPSPVVDTIANFNFAKKLHKENLEHEPLPDTVTDALYRKLQMQKHHKDPGLVLEETPQVTGIGWKGYPGYGPTQCTKLKVYRPKTGVPGKHSDKRDGRPNSVSSFDKKWRFIRQTKVTPIELAICWDLAPVNPDDEPKPTTHIDGSNGSLAPAVFALVHSPKEENVSVKSSRKSSAASSKSSQNPQNPVFDHLQPGDTTDEALPFLDRPTTTHGRDRRKSSSVKSRVQSAPNIHQICKEDKMVQYLETHLTKKRTHENSPNVNCSTHCKKGLPNSRLCMACEMKNIKLKDTHQKPEYKMAFKAGVPQPPRIVSTAAKATLLFRIPRQKDPYRKKNYSINSLAAPFSLQKDKRQDYPEHWRLATIYQHSYKPIHARKRPLLASIFK